LQDEKAVRAGLVNVVTWLRDCGWTNVMLETANEYPHQGFVHPVLRTPEAQASLLRLAKQTGPRLLVSASGYGDGKLHDTVAKASDFLLVHFNSTPVDKIPERIAALRKFGKPIVCNEDDKTGQTAAWAAAVCVSNGVSWGLMLKHVNQYTPWRFGGAADDPVVYATLKRLCTTPAAKTYFPLPECQGGWRTLAKPDEIRELAGMNPTKLADLKQWLLASDQRNFAAVVIRHGYVVLEVERGNSAKTDTRRVASVSKAVCATVLAIASEQSQRGLTSRKMTFNDRAFDFIPWAQPLSDPRKAQITVKQLLNHTSGICPEATGAPNDGTWEYILGHSGKGIPADARYKPGSGGQLVAFVPSLDLIITRQTGSSGEWAFEEYLRRACAAVLLHEE
jgi:hypothetical protein